VVGCLGFTFNLAYQVFRKPTELVGLFDSRFHKTPDETWKAYGPTFEAKATPILTPELLAALAQVETNGNPIARTYWKWTWTSDLARLYAPASSAAGLFQMTEGTFREAQHFCVVQGQARRAEQLEDCGALRSRLIPAHAIEMTAARLQWHVERILALLRGHKQKAALRDRQRLATVIHLCGIQRGEAFARARFSLAKLGRCGDHDAAKYVRRVEKLAERFRSLRADARLSVADR
jgi:hypothetical protein